MGGGCGRTLAAGETLGQGELVRSTSDLATILKMASSVSPQKGGRPLSRMYRITPKLHMSASWL